MTLMRTLTAGAAAIALTSAFATVATPVLAQQTDAGIRGTIVDGNGNPVAGANVTILHTPTGTGDSATSTSNGTFFEGGLRVGGPYTLTIAAPGYEAEVIEGLYLEPGSAERIIINLSELVAADEILVIGRNVQQIDLNNGAGSAFDRETISNQPSVSRDVIDTLLRDPLVNASGGTGEISIGGVNPRLNALALDGVLQGDDFGLSQSIYPTQRAPISLEAIESASVVASDYSVESSGFVGGLVNIVTKSGTNEFSGSGYWFRSGQNFLGEISDGTLVPAPEFKEREWGASISGPIVKDRVFFFLNYEDFSAASPVNFGGNDASIGILDPDAFYSLLNQRILDATGFDGGGRPPAGSPAAETRRWLGKIDVNITDDHRLEASYQRTRESNTSVSSTSFSSAFYETPQDLDSYSGALFSDWTDSLSTTLRVGYKDNTRGQNCRAGSSTSELELFELNPGDLDSAFDGLIDDALFTDVSIISGCDRFRHANTFSDDRLQIFASADYQLNEHLITFGAEFEDYNAENLFVERASGRFRYDNLAELASGDGVEVSFRRPLDGDVQNAITEFGFSKFSAFLQDEWQLLPTLSFNLGLRYERFFQDDPAPRADFEALYGRSSANSLDGIDIFLPRFGFQYEPFERTTVSGGFGLFAGGSPQVWVSNAFNPFILEVTQTLDDTAFGTVPTSVQTAFDTFDPNTPNSIDLIDPDFKIPSQWKGSLRVSQGFDMNLADMFGLPSFFNFGDDYRFTAQYLYTNVRNDFIWENVAQTELGLPIGVAPDGRPIYSNLEVLGVNNAVQLTNTSEGRSHVITAALAKKYEMGFDFDVSYAYQDVDTASSVIGSSRGISLYRSLFTSDRNNPEAITAPFETQHAFNLNFGYENELFRNLRTRFDLFATITSGSVTPVTFNTSSSNPLFGSPGNGESPFDNDLLYVPTFSGSGSTDAAVVFGSGFDLEAFAAFVEDQGLTQGEIVEGGEVRTRWNQLWNFRFQQELPFTDFGVSYLEGNRLNLVVDIFNVANLINDRWGVRNDGPRFTALNVVSADLVSAADVEANGVDGATSLGSDPAGACASAGDCIYRYNTFTERGTTFPDLDDSVYQIRVGIRYDF